MSEVVETKELRPLTPTEDPPSDDEVDAVEKDPEEIIIAMVGNVDSTKSTTIGVLTDPSGALDNGKGKARSRLFNFPHEHITGRTSSVGHAYIKESDKIVNFIDLAGHEKYLKTTIHGITSHAPDYAFVCISEKLTEMTRDHMQLLCRLEIPFGILFTKSDVLPPKIVKTNLKRVSRILKIIENTTAENLNESKNNLPQREIMEVSNTSELDDVFDNPLQIPLLKISNVTGVNLPLLRHLYRKVHSRGASKTEGQCFTIDRVYRVVGHGTVITGANNMNVKVGDELYMGPFDNGIFEPVRVRSIHDDYRQNVNPPNCLKPGVRGCLCITFKGKSKKDAGHLHKRIRSGMVASRSIPKVSRKFDADISVFHHSTTIKNGYVAYVNCGSVHESVVFLNVQGPLRSGDTCRVTLKFVNNVNYVEKGARFLFREGQTRGLGRIVGVTPYEHKVGGGKDIIYGTRM
jgi:GTPase